MAMNPDLSVFVKHFKSNLGFKDFMKWIIQNAFLPFLRPP